MTRTDDIVSYGLRNDFLCYGKNTVTV